MIREIHQRDDALVQQLLAIWESAVRPTHLFLTEKDIMALRPQVAAAIRGIPSLCVREAEEGVIQAFCGVEKNKLEMLFVDSACHGQGFGGQLVRYAVAHLGVRLVDVNEQNPQGIGFYRHMGFEVTRRSDTDDQGRPFPILHMKLPPCVPLT